MIQKTTSQYTSSPAFEGLILHYLDQLENLLPVLVLVQILPFSEFLVDSTSLTAKLATMIGAAHPSDQRIFVDTKVISSSAFRGDTMPPGYWEHQPGLTVYY